MNLKTLKETIRQELPALLRDDPNLRDYILELTRREYAGRTETQDRFYEMLGELRRDREEQTRKWDEQARQWEVHQTDLRNEFKRIHEEIMAQTRKHESSIGALGARWGLQSEKAFRDGLAAILEKTFEIQVLRVNKYDFEGEVFGRPDQVELDVIIRNGVLILCELKSSIDKAGMYIFERKARFYEKHHQRQATRLLVISPMIDGRAKQVAEKLGIETYGYTTEVEEL